MRALRNTSGMTLLEIMIVLAILGGLIAILANQVVGRLDKARVQEAKIQMSELNKSLDMFYTDCGFYPEALDSLMEAPSNCPNWGPDPYIRKLPKDPWGKEFIYELDGGSPVIISLGKGGKEGGSGYEADINSAEL